jgi:hypothetical protein
MPIGLNEFLTNNIIKNNGNGRKWVRTTDLVINSHTRCLLRHPTLHSLRRNSIAHPNALTAPSAPAAPFSKSAFLLRKMTLVRSQPRPSPL